jgi:GNAT superfamily N-acetyltransferase
MPPEPASPPRLRTAAAADQGAIGALAEAAGLFPAAALPALIGPALAGNAPDLWVVAETDAAVAGFAFAAPEPFTEGTWTLRAIAADPARRRVGTGTALLAATEARLAGLGVRLLVIETSDAPAQQAGRAFYRTRGCREAARIADFWAPGTAKVIFVRAVMMPGPSPA